MAKSNLVKVKKSAQEAVIISEMGQMPPHDIKLEEAVLGALLIDTKAYDRVYDLLSPETFYDKTNRLIFTAIEELGKQNEPIDMLTVSEKLKKEGLLEDAGSLNKVVMLTNSVSSSVHARYHAELLREKYIAREMIGFCVETEQDCYNGNVPMKELLQKTEDKLYNLSLDEDRQKVSSMKEMLFDVAKEIEAASQREGLSGIESGFYELDRKTSGWQKSDLIILAARPAMGKTAMLLSMAKNMADANHPVLIFSLEMSKSQLAQRLIVNATELPASKIKSGKLNNGDWIILNNQMGLLERMPIFIDDSANQTVFEMATKARRMVREKGIECIFIDYLQLMHAEGKTINNREQEVSTISRALKQLAKELNIPVIALSQLNRGVESRVGDNKRPVLSDLRESGAIEQDADMVLMLHRPEYYGILEDEEGNSTIGKAEVIIAKNRNGSTGRIRLGFEGELIKFTNLNEIPVHQSDFVTASLEAKPAPADEDKKKKKGEPKKKDDKKSTSELPFTPEDQEDEDDDWKTYVNNEK